MKENDWGEAKDVQEEGLLSFIPPLPGPLRLLSIDSTRFLPELRQRLPRAEIHAMTSFQDAAELPRMQALDIHWLVKDFRMEDLPYEKGSFDIIFAEPCLEFAYEPYDTLLHINSRLKPTGYLVSQFPNVRHYKVLEQLRAGRFPGQERRYFAKEEVVRMLSDALYQSITFVPFGQEAEADVAAWEDFGFQNFSLDLQTKTWMFRADRSTAEVAALKGLYTKEIRTELARILHRIEYGIDVENQMAALQELCQKEMVFADYLKDFIHEAVFHEQDVRNLLAARGILDRADSYN